MKVKMEMKTKSKKKGSLRRNAMQAFAIPSQSLAAWALSTLQVVVGLGFFLSIAAVVEWIL